MPKTWDYAQLSKSAKEAGGPNSYEKKIENKGKSKGVLGLGILIGLLQAGLLIKKVIQFSKRK